MTEDGSQFRWQVDAGMIDLGRWAAAVVAVITEPRAERSRVTRFGIWPLLGAVLVILAVLSPWMAIVVVVPGAVIVVGARVWNRRAAVRIAKGLQRIPAAADSFRFAAHVQGTESQSPTGSDRIAWSRYKAVTLHEGLLVLTLDNGFARIVTTPGFPQSAVFGCSAAVR